MRGEPQPLELVTLALSDLVTSEVAMVEVLQSGRVSDTPEEPISVCVRVDAPGFFEVSDGHHRIAAALRADLRDIRAYVRAEPDDEPYMPPFYVFPAK